MRPTTPMRLLALLACTHALFAFEAQAQKGARRAVPEYCDERQALTDGVDDS